MTTPDLVYQLKIVLRESQPPVWRRIQVPAPMPLNRLHRTLQVAMGWTDAHLHEFAIAGRRYREPRGEDDPLDIVNERMVTLHHVAPGERGQFSYLYDFGDNGEHEIVIEKIMAPEPGAHYPVCLAGERHCPPEDCGGIPGLRGIPGGDPRLQPSAAHRDARLGRRPLRSRRVHSRRRESRAQTSPMIPDPGRSTSRADRFHRNRDTATARVSLSQRETSPRHSGDSVMTSSSA